MTAPAATDPTAAAIEVRDLVFRYPGRDRPVLDRLTLAVAAGERVAVLGANGCGKTTFVLHLNGLLERQAGDVVVGGLRVERSTLADVRRRVGMVFQHPDDQLFMATVRDDVAFGPANLGLRGAALAERTTEALAQVGATALAGQAPHHLSGGEKRRAALATVMAMAPEVLVLDEPTAELDPVGRRELAELLARLTATQLIVTHDLPFALATCPRAVIIDDGRVVVDGPTRTVLGDPSLLARHRLELPFGYPPPA